MVKRESLLLLVLISTAIVLAVMYIRSKLNVDVRQTTTIVENNMLSQIVDPTLRQCAIEALRKTTTGKYEDVHELSTLRRNNLRYIDDFTGIDKLLPNLRILLANSDTHDISPIYNLQHLEILYITGYSGKNIDGIQKLQNLHELTINFCSIEDISALSALNNLEKLKIFVSDNEKVLQLSGLTNLREFYVVNGTPRADKTIEEIIPRLDATHLDMIEIQTESTEAISAISMYKNLRILVVNAQVDTFRPISKLPNLQDVYYICYPEKEYMNRETDILDWCSRDVKTIFVIGDYLHDERIAEFQQLERLAVRRGRDIDVTPICKLAKLRELQLNWMKTVNLSLIEQNSSLERLYLFEVKNVSDDLMDELGKRPNFQVFSIRNQFEQQISIPHVLRASD